MILNLIVLQPLPLFENLSQPTPKSSLPWKQTNNKPTDTLNTPSTTSTYTTDTLSDSNNQLPNSTPTSISSGIHGSNKLNNIIVVFFVG